MLKKVAPKIFLSPPLFQPEQLIPLRDAGIRHVVNAAGYENRSLFEEAGFSYHIARFLDNGRAQDQLVWEQLKLFLDPILADPEAKLAIHCIGGPRRSAAVAYLALRLQGITDEAARQYLACALPEGNLCYCGHINEWLDARTRQIFPHSGG
jgi:protein-tyrosine phosphatase